MAALVLVATAGSPTATAQAEDAVTIHQDVQHTGATSDLALAPPLHQLWSSQVGGPQASTLYSWYPIVAEGRIFVPESVDNDDAKLVALDAASGAVLWQVHAPYGIGLAYDQHMLYVAGIGHGMQALDPATGAVRWDVAAIYDDLTGGPPTAASGQIVTAAGSEVEALSEADGAQLWHTDTHSSMSGDAALVGDRVFVSQVGPHVFGFDRSSGATLWHDSGSQYGGGFPGIATRDGRVWGQSGISTWLQNPDGSSYSGWVPGDVVDAGTGALLGHFSSQHAPALTATTAVFYGGDGRLSAVDARTLQLLWSVDEGAAVFDVVVVDDTIYALTDDKRLLAVSLANGATLSRVVLPGIGADLSVGDGRLVVNGDGWVTAYTGTQSGSPVAAVVTPPPPQPTAAGKTTGTSLAKIAIPTPTPACTLRRRANHPNILDVSCHTALTGASMSGRLTRDGTLVARLTGRTAHSRATMIIRLHRRPPAGTYRISLTLRTKARSTSAVHTVALR